MAEALRTVGHGTLPKDEFTELVRDAGLQHIIDIRAYPGSRRHPHFARDALAQSLDAASLEYSWVPELGGRRSGTRDSPNHALTVPAFRAYADYMMTDTFAAALTELLETAQTRPSAVMCAESVWWRCHRRLVADAATLLHDYPVLHLFHDRREVAHTPMAAARVEAGHLIYDVGAARPLDAS